MTDAVRTRVSQQGRIVVSALFRKALGIAAGDELILQLEDNELRITTKQRHTNGLTSVHADTYNLAGRQSKKLLVERRGEAEGE